MKSLKYFLAVCVFSLYAVSSNANIINVNVIDNTFQPGVIHANVGDQIRWTLVNGSHTTTSSSVPGGAATWDYTFTGTGDTYNYTITVAGTYDYECLFHPGMTGQIIASSAASSSLLVENFSYSTGQLTTVSGGTWIQNSGTGNFIPVGSGNLTYTDYTASGIGSMITLVSTTASAEDAYANFTPQSTAGTSVYASFLLNVTNQTGLTSGGDYFMLFINSTSTSNFHSRLYIRSAGSGYNLGIKFDANASNPIQWDSQELSTGQTQLIVFSYKMVEGNLNDVAELWINPPLTGSIPPPNVSQTNMGITADMADVGRIQIRQGTGGTPNANIDGIKVSNTWNDAPLPVELTDLVATTIKNEVILDWATGGEMNNDGFEIQRVRVTAGDDPLVYETVGFVPGNGTSNQVHHYRFVDRGLTTGVYRYKLKQRDFNNHYTYFLLESDVVIGVPEKFALSQNYPNPFNPQTKIKLELPFDGRGDITVYDINGRVVTKMISGDIKAGYQYIDFNGDGLASGVYFYRLNFEGGGQKFTEMKKMLLVK